MFGPPSSRQEKSKISSSPDEKTSSKTISVDSTPQEEYLDGVFKWREQATRRRAQRGGQACEHANGSLESKQYCPKCPLCDATPRSLRSHRLANDLDHFKSENPQFEQGEPFFASSSTSSSYTLIDRDHFRTPIRESSSEIPSAPSLGLANLGTRDVTRLGLSSTSCAERILMSRCEASQSFTVSMPHKPTAGQSTRPVAYETYAGTSIDESEIKEEARKGTNDNARSGITSSNGNTSSSSVPSITRLRLVSGLSRTELPPPDLLDVNRLGSGAEETYLPGSIKSNTDSESDGECLAGRYLPDDLKKQTPRRRPLTISTLDPCGLSPGCLELVDNLFPTFDSRWTANFTDHTGPRGSVSSSTTISKSTTDSATNSSLSNQGSKRSRDNNDEPPSDAEDDPPGQSRLNLRGPQNQDASLKLACPFRKHDPGKYNLGSHRACATAPWENMTRLKEHLHRVHTTIFCQKCKLQFRTEKALETHVKGLDAAVCSLTTGPIPEGISPDIANKLKGRKKASQSDQEHWKDIFRILFPEAPIPAPYFEPILDSISYRHELIRTLLVRLDNADIDNPFKEKLANMVMDCDAQLTADHRFNQGNAEHRSVPSTEIKRQSLQDQARPSKIQLRAGWKPKDDLEALPAEELRSKIGLCPILPKQPSTFASAFPLKPPFSLPVPQSCFCVGKHTCLSAPGPSAASTSYGDLNMHTTQPAANWTEDSLDESWMESYINTNNYTEPDTEN